jgi:hypothetical protein
MSSMPRRVTALLVGTVLGLGAAACSSSDPGSDSSSASPSTTLSVEAEASTTTTVDTDIDTDTDTDTPGIGLGDLSGSSATDDVTAADEECINEAAADEPLLADATTYSDLVTTAQKQAFWEIAIDCVGSELLIDLFMEGFTENAPNLTTGQIQCARDEVTALSRAQAVALLSEDPVVSDQLTDAIVDNCLT